MIKSNDGKVEIEGKGEDVLVEFASLVAALYESNIINDNIYCTLGASVSALSDLGVFSHKGSSIQVDVDELKKQMKGEE